MAKRKRIGILYTYNENWVGGSYYIQNLIRSLNFLPSKEQPFLHIVTQDEKTFQQLKEATGYSKLKYVADKVTYNAVEKLINKIAVRLLKRKIIVKKVQLDWLFPLYNIPNNLKHIAELVFWIPDLQEKHLPTFFSEEEIAMRHQYCLEMIRLNHPIVFSSFAAKNDFDKFYPDSKNSKHVIQFAVTHPKLSNKNIEQVKAKYAIKGDYFFSPNQFWQHKNHIAIIEAAKILKDKGEAVTIVFTGKEHDYRNPEYTDNLKQKVKEYQLEDEILFLGFIDRDDQLLLMKNAQAVIQPSLCEGWSTVVEDAKALNQTVIASKIDVHQEQLEDSAYYFQPNNYGELAAKMNEVVKNPSLKLKYKRNYNQNIEKFALDLKQIINLA